MWVGLAVLVGPRVEQQVGIARTQQRSLVSQEVVVQPRTTREALPLPASPPVYAALDRLERAGVLREATGRRRGKLYVYDQYLAILNEGTEPE